MGFQKMINNPERFLSLKNYLKKVSTRGVHFVQEVPHVLVEEWRPSRLAVEDGEHCLQRARLGGAEGDADAVEGGQVAHDLPDAGGVDQHEVRVVEAVGAGLAVQ